MVSCAAALSIVTPKEELDRILSSKTFEMPKKQNKWIFKTAQTDTSAVETIYEHMKKKGITRVALITVTAGFGDFGRQELKRVAPVYGITDRGRRALRAEGFGHERPVDQDQGNRRPGRDQLVRRTARRSS